jgi:tRNA modification GTPase
MKPSYGDRGSIAALATSRSGSALALIRTSGGGSGGEGPNALELLAKIFSEPQRLLKTPGNSVVHGWIVDPERCEKLDEVLVSVYRGPKSYTGEDGADISCHGGPATVRAVIKALKTAGFRDSLPGEFTFRAFMNGKLDLTRCESVMELVSAKSDKGRRQAVRRLAGTLEKEINGIKTLLVQVLSGVEISLDYSEDEMDLPASEGEAAFPDRALALEAKDRLKSLAESWRMERLYAGGALVVIAGRPNAGKSSLFNVLLKEDRSIVTGIPGTTRDWIEAAVSAEGIPLRLADTAGLREPAPVQPEDAGMAGTVERIGIERSRELLKEADLVLYVIDGALGISREDRNYLREFENEGGKKIPVLALWNKADIASPPRNPKLPELIKISAKTGEGTAALLKAIPEALEKAACLAGPERSGTGPGSERQKDLICAALASVEEALALADRGGALDLIAPLLREGINCLGEITGEVSTADILETMFSRFCAGK